MKPVYCSFCGKEKAYVRLIVAGPNAGICDECVDLCAEHIREHEEAKEVIGEGAHDFDPAAMDELLDEIISRANNLAAAAKKLVELMDDAEKNHGGLVGTITLRSKNELRLELAKWR